MQNMLKFKSGQFKLLVISDIQIKGIPDRTECDALSHLVEKANPDLIVFLGDMIETYNSLRKTKLRRMIHAIIDATAGNNIPFAVVSGNHDHYAAIPYYRQLEIYREYNNCLTPSKHNRICKNGYTIDLIDKNGDLVYRLLFLDCPGTKIYGVSYKKTKAPTLAFTKELLAEPSCPPAIIFQHYVVPDIVRLFDISDQKSAGSVKGKGPYRGKYLKLKHPESGVLGECPCPSWENTTQFSDWQKSGKVRMAVSAHDHRNSFVDTLENIDMV